jgi:hypothetical protein
MAGTCGPAAFLWVTTSHLNGIFGLEETDPKLYERLAAGE